jgi:uncharacterized protein YjbI with pentapeptide repeats
MPQEALYQGTPYNSYTRLELLYVLETATAEAPAAIEGALFSGLDLGSLRFDHVSFRSCVFVNCSLDAATMIGLRMKWCRLIRCSLVGANLSRATLVSTELQDCRLEHTSFQEADLEKCLLENLTGEHVDFTGARVSGAEFRRGQLNCVELRHANVQSTAFTELSFSHVAFEQAVFETCRFSGSGIRLSFFDCTKMLNCTFEKSFAIDRCSVRDSSFEGSCFKDGTVKGCIMHGASFHNTQISGGSFRHNSLQDCDMSDATIKTDLAETVMIDGPFTNSSIASTVSYGTMGAPKGYKYVQLLNGWANERLLVLLGPAVKVPAVQFGTINRDLCVDLTGLRSRANFEGCSFEYAQLGPGAWDGANLRDVTFSFVDLRGADFTGADLTGAKFLRNNTACGADAPAAKYGIRGLDKSYDLGLAPVIYDEKTRWPDGFSIPEIACDFADLVKARELNQTSLMSLDPTSDGLVFMPSADVYNTMTYLFAALPDLFETCGPFAVPTGGAIAAEMALTRFASSVRKDDAGNKIENFREKLEFAAMAAATAWTAAQVRATQDTKTNFVDELAQMLADAVASRRRANRYAAKKEVNK